MDKEMLRKQIADYQKIAGTWQHKETIEERMAAWREEQELEGRARFAERCLAADLPRKPPTEEQLVQYVEASCEYLGVKSSDILRQIFRRNKP